MSAKAATVIAIIVAVIITGYVLVFSFNNQPAVLHSGIKGSAYLEVGCGSGILAKGKCVKQPIQTELQILSGGRVVKTFSTDSGGDFLIYLPPGSYNVSKEALAPIPSLKKTAFVVIDDQFTDLELKMDLVKY
jgi:hypothetical protein